MRRVYQTPALDSFQLPFETKPHFRGIASIAYQNGVNVPSDVTSMVLKDDDITDKVSSMASKVCEGYDKARGNEKQREM